MTEISFIFFTNISSVQYSCPLNVDLISQYLIEMVAPICIFMLTIILAAVYYSVQFMQESLTNFLLYTASIFFSGIFF